MTFDEKRYNNHNKEHDNHDVIMLMSTYITYLHIPLSLFLNRETYINSHHEHEEEFYLHFNIRRN